jgi:hypothetical protein
LYGRVEAVATDSTIDEMLVCFVILGTYGEESTIMYWFSPEFDVESWWENTIHDKVVVFTVEPHTTSFMMNRITTSIIGSQGMTPCGQI